MSSIPKKVLTKGSFSNLHASKYDSDMTHRRASPIYPSDQNTSLLEHLKSAETSRNFFDSSVNDYLKISNGIQDDIKLLTEMCQNSFVYKDWGYINELLYKNGYEAVLINECGGPDMTSVVEILIVLVGEIEKLKADYFQTPGVEIRTISSLDESCPALRRNDKENYLAIFKKSMKKNYDRHNSIDQSVMSIISKCEEHKEICQETIEDLKDQVEYFKNIMNQSIRSSPDMKDHDNRLVKEIIHSCGVNTQDEIIDSIEKMKKIIKVVPSLEQFVEEVCQELLPHTVQERTYENYSKAILDVIPTIKEMKSLLDHLQNFREKVYSNLKFSNNISEKIAIDNIKAVRYFEKLFEVKQGEDLLGVMEQLFLFVHEIRLFVQTMKSALNIDKNETVGKVLEAIKKIIVK